MTYYKKHYINDNGDWQIWQWRDNQPIRKVGNVNDCQYSGYLEWLDEDENNIPEEVAYVAPPPPEPIYKKVISRLEFMRRFTPLEMGCILSSEDSDIEVKVLTRQWQAAEAITLDDPLAVQGIDILISKGIIDSTRKDEILFIETI